jgi:hypothetical protein
MSVLETLIRAHLLDNGLLPRILIITADDYGYSPAYDRGILEAAQGGSVDAVSVMVNPKDLDPEPLLNTGAEVGLHYVLPFGMGRAGEGTAPRAGDEERRAAVAEPAELDTLPGGVTEWIVHPGHRDPAAGSSYDAGREEDLRLLLELGDREKWRSRGVERRSHADALAG